MIEERTRAAIDVLQRSLAEQLEQVAMTRRMINQLLAMSGAPPLYVNDTEMPQSVSVSVGTLPKS